MAQPPFLLTYYNPFSDDPKKNSLVGSYLDYVKNTSLAKYSADVVGGYLAETSQTQLAATESVGRAICGELYDGFSSLQAQIKQTGLRQAQQLGEISGGIRQISSELRQVFGALEGVNQRLELVRDEVKTSNVLLENIGELLRIPDSQKQRQHHIELALKFLKNARKDQDLYQDALQDLLDAEKLKRDDFFVLHRIGMIFLYAPDLIDLEKAADYFTRAAKYAAVESEPDAARLSNVLNKRVNKKFADQADRLPDKKSDETSESFEDSISALAAESYFQAGTALYALGRFDEAAKMAEKAVVKKTGEAKYHFYCAKYLTRSGKHEDAVKPIQKAIELSPELAMAAVEDLDLNRSEAILKALNKANASANTKLQNGITNLQQWIDKYSIKDNDLSKWMTTASVGLKNSSYPQKQALLSTLAEHKKLLKRLDSVVSFGFKLDIKAAINLLKQNDKKQARLLAEKKTNSKYINDPKLAALKYAPSRWSENAGILYDILLATVDNSFFTPTGTIKWEVESDTIPAAGEDGMVYIGLNNNLIALDKETSRECWRFCAGATVETPIAGGYMVFFNASNDIFALDGRTGRQIWKHDQGGVVRRLDGNGTIFSDTKTNIYAIDGNTGKRLWGFTKPEGFAQSMIACASRSIFVVGRNKVIAIDSMTGNKLWNVSIINESSRKERSDVRYTTCRTDRGGDEPDENYKKRWFTLNWYYELAGEPISTTYDHANDSLYVVFPSAKHREYIEDCWEEDAFGLSWLEDGSTDKLEHRQRIVDESTHNLIKLDCKDGSKHWARRVVTDKSDKSARAHIAIDESYIYTGGENCLNSIILNEGVVANSMPIRCQVRGLALGHGLIYLVGYDVGKREATFFSIDKKSGGLLTKMVIFQSVNNSWCPIIVDKSGMIYIHYQKKAYYLYSGSEKETVEIWPMYRQNPQGTGCATMPHFSILPLERNDGNPSIQIDSTTVLTTSSKASLPECHLKLSGADAYIEAQTLEKSKQADVNLKLAELEKYGVPFNHSRATCFLTYNYENRFYIGLLNDEWEARKNTNSIILHSGLQEIAKKDALNIAEKILFVTADESCFATATERQQVKEQNCGTSAEGETISIQPQVVSVKPLNSLVNTFQAPKPTAIKPVLTEFDYESCAEDVVGKPEDIVGYVSDAENINTEEAKRLMDEGLAAEAKERAKWFRKKDFSIALELYRQAAAAGSTEATAKVEELTKLIAVN